MGNIDNIRAKGAEFEFAGKMRKMVFINRAVQYLKDKHGGFQKSIMKIDDENNDIDYDVLTDILYAGFMVNKDETITPQFVRDALDDLPIFETKEIATTHLVAALTGTYPEPKKKAVDSGTPQ